MLGFDSGYYYSVYFHVCMVFVLTELLEWEEVVNLGGLLKEVLLVQQ